MSSYTERIPDPDRLEGRTGCREPQDSAREVAKLLRNSLNQGFRTDTQARYAPTHQRRQEIRRMLGLEREPVATFSSVTESSGTITLSLDVASSNEAAPEAMRSGPSERLDPSFQIPFHVGAVKGVCTFDAREKERPLQRLSRRERRDSNPRPPA
jgi:hypothetical protein